MNGNFIGTGISCIFYLALALMMPIMLLIRVVRHGRRYSYRFVSQHFAMSIIISAALVGISTYIWHQTGLYHQTHLREIQVELSWITLGILALWAMVPRAVQASYVVRRKRHVIQRHNTLIHTPRGLVYMEDRVEPTIVGDILK